MGPWLLEPLLWGYLGFMGLWTGSIFVFYYDTVIMRSGKSLLCPIVPPFSLYWLFTCVAFVPGYIETDFIAGTLGMSYTMRLMVTAAV